MMILTQALSTETTAEAWNADASSTQVEAECCKMIYIKSSRKVNKNDEHLQFAFEFAWLPLPPPKPPHPGSPEIKSFMKAILTSNWKSPTEAPKRCSVGVRIARRQTYSWINLHSVNISYSHFRESFLVHSPGNNIWGRAKVALNKAKSTIKIFIFTQF